MDVSEPPPGSLPDDVARLLVHGAHEIKHQVVSDHPGPCQVEGVVDDLGPVRLVELVAVGVEAPRDVLPVVPVVVDPVVSCKRTYLPLHLLFKRKILTNPFLER